MRSGRVAPELSVATSNGLPRNRMISGALHCITHHDVRVTLAVFIAGIASAQQGTSGSAADIGGIRARLYGIVSSQILGSINRNDARAALKVWFNIVAQQRGFVLDSKVEVEPGIKGARRRCFHQRDCGGSRCLRGLFCSGGSGDAGSGRRPGD